MSTVTRVTHESPQIDLGVNRPTFKKESVLKFHIHHLSGNVLTALGYTVRQKPVQAQQLPHSQRQPDVAKVAETFQPDPFEIHLDGFILDAMGIVRGIKQ